MSNEFNHKRRYSRYFMAPLWIALALCGMVLAFLLGGDLVTDEWSQTGQGKLAAVQARWPRLLCLEPVSPSLNADAGQPLVNLGTSETSPPKPESLSTLVWTSPASRWSGRPKG